MAERYLTIARQLRKAIADGHYSPGTALPGRLDLARQYETTRGTIDRTIRFLVEQGIVESRHGAGTFVNEIESSTRIAIVGHMPGDSQAHGFSLHGFDRQSMHKKSNRDVLNQYDGVIWHLPTAEVRQWIKELPDAIPQVVINRDYPEINFITTDHKGMYEAETASRINMISDANLIFIQPDVDHFVIEKRLEGFVEACRKSGKKFDTLRLPDDFEDSLALLNKSLAPYESTPLILVGSALAVTGAVMAWARLNQRSWQKDVLYSDFDNEYSVNVWGRRVTSYIQDYGALLDTALIQLGKLIRHEIDSVQMYVPAIRVDGNT